MNIDSHQHFLKYNHAEYGWIGEDMELLKRDYLPNDLEPLLQQNNFDGSVAVQARQCLAETEWLLELSSQHDFIKAVVGWIDLCSPDVERQLDRFSQSGKMAGVRHVIHDEPDPDFMLRSDFLRGLNLLGKYGLTFDLLLFPGHLPNAIRLVSQFPEQLFVVDHLSKPFIKKNETEPWAKDLADLARFPNVWCKLSGMVTEADWNKWDSNTFKPYLDIIFDTFGTDRLMTGSDWPVCLLGGDYGRIINIVSEYLRNSDITVRNKIMGENCREFYGIRNK